MSTLLTTNSAEILLPVLALISWTCVMFFWLYLTRIPAINNAKIDLQSIKIAGTIKGKLPVNIEAVADNYNHLMEHPTIFYAMCFYLAIIGHVDSIQIILAWTYVVLRIAHSLIQNTVNIVLLRFAIFATSGLVLVIMVIREWLNLLG